jgi:hypothetical protein
MRYTKVDRRINETVNRLNKTKEDKTIDYEAEKAAQLAIDKKRRKDEGLRQKAIEDQERKKKQEQDELKCYGSVFTNADMASNKRSGPVDPKKFEEDFF